MKRAIFILLCLFLIACKKTEVIDNTTVVVEEPKTIPEPVKEPEVISEPEVAPEPKVQLACTHNANCSQEENCVNGKCLMLEELYKTDGCEKTCNIKRVQLTTSDGEKYDVPRGDGSYAAAGALEWTILKTPDYCEGEEVLVPIKVFKRNYQNVLGDEIITLKEGEMSPIITHPIRKSLKFTITVAGVEETCQ